MTKGANSSPENILKLAQAIVKSLSENNCAELQSIGAVAVNNAIKAYIKAKGMISEYVNGVELVCQFSYQKPVIDGKQITAIKMNIFAIPSKFVI
jgi:stage V sporulation protein S